MNPEEKNSTFFLLRSSAAAEEKSRSALAGLEEARKQAAILVVDDSEPLRTMLVMLLRQQGYENVSEAGDGLAALNLIRAREFDLVLLDIEMPVMTGVELLTVMKQEATLARLPVIVISGQGSEEVTMRCIELGAEDYLPKPYSTVLLRARMGSSLEKKRLRDQDRGRLLDLQAEQEKSERLLLNILPKPIAERLKAGEQTIADHHAAVTVLFADLVGFTQLSSRTQPGNLVTMLNEIFTAFDRLVEKHGWKKSRRTGTATCWSAAFPWRARIMPPLYARWRWG